MPEFDYKQRKTTDSYRKGWEKVFSVEKKWNEPFGNEPKAVKEMSNAFSEVNDMLKESETTEQKQPSLKD